MSKKRPNNFFDIFYQDFLIHLSDSIRNCQNELTESQTPKNEEEPPFPIAMCLMDRVDEPTPYNGRAEPAFYPSLPQGSPGRMYNHLHAHPDLVHAGLVGLRNIGNTCFMNCVVQCLSNTRPLLEYLLDNRYQHDLNTINSSMKGNLIRAFSNVINELWEPNSNSRFSSRCVTPTGLKTQIQRFAPRFMGYNQQDAQEFLRYLLEGLHEDVNRIIQRPKPNVTEIDDSLRLALNVESEENALRVFQFNAFQGFWFYRFSPNERFRGKLNVTIDFPIKGLDLSSYAASRGEACRYNLYGIANHSGTPFSGHYTAMCKHPYNGEWNSYNDSRVSNISSPNLVSSEAYVLFYENS